MKRFKIQISQEETQDNNRSKLFNPRKSKEEIIFQILLPEEEIDIKAVFRQIVAGREK